MAAVWVGKLLRRIPTEERTLEVQVTFVHGMTEDDYADEALEELLRKCDQTMEYYFVNKATEKRKRRLVSSFTFKRPKGV